MSDSPRASSDATGMPCSVGAASKPHVVGAGATPLAFVRLGAVEARAGSVVERAAPAQAMVGESRLPFARVLPLLHVAGQIEDRWIRGAVALTPTPDRGDGGFAGAV